MTKENLITPVGTTLDEAETILQEHKIEKLPLVENGRLEGLITIKDIEKVLEFLMRKMRMDVTSLQLSVHLKIQKFVLKN